jgi:hypothetical protein
MGAILAVCAVASAAGKRPAAAAKEQELENIDQV